MKKLIIAVLVSLGLVLVFATVKPVTADAATVPSRFRHAWYFNLPLQKKNPLFIKFTKSSIDTGDKTYHSKISGSNLQVIKRAKDWYQIGYKGVNSARYKVTKKKISGVKRYVLLKLSSASSHYADVFMLGRKHVLPLADSTVRV